MTTYYTQVPTLRMRVQAVPLIVVGRVARTLEQETEYHDNQPWVRRTVEIEVDEVLKGRVDTTRVAVQVLASDRDGAATPMTHATQEGARVVLLLSAGEKPGVYVPYLGSAFEVTADGRVRLGAFTADQLEVAAVGASSDERTVPLEVLRTRLAEAAARAGGEEVDVSEGVIPPLTLEMPTGHDGGGQPSAPDAGLPDRQ